MLVVGATFFWSLVPVDFLSLRHIVSSRSPSLFLLTDGLRQLTAFSYRLLTAVSCCYLLPHLISAHYGRFLLTLFVQLCVVTRCRLLLLIAPITSFCCLPSPLVLPAATTCCCLLPPPSCSIVTFYCRLPPLVANNGYCHVAACCLRLIYRVAACLCLLPCCACLFLYRCLLLLAATAYCYVPQQLLPGSCHRLLLIFAPAYPFLLLAQISSRFRIWELLPTSA